MLGILAEAKPVEFKSKLRIELDFGFLDRELFWLLDLGLFRGGRDEIHYISLYFV